ncbi:MAG: hypothetical protein RL166_96 [Actinomycetota bacterium]|jgi:hypothetical protein
MLHYARFRPRITKLTLPWVWLGLTCAGISFASTYKLSEWMTYTVWATAAVLILILFVWPALRFSATYFDIHSSGLSLRLGPGASKRVELDWPSISGITTSPLKGIVVRTKEENEYILRGYSNQKAIVAELNTLLGRK